MSPMQKSIWIHILLSLLISPPVFSGTLYFWTDDKGIKHFSNIAPPPATGVATIKEEELTLPPGLKFTVVKVFDGDTIQVAGFDLKFKVRLVGIDSPETGKRGKKGQPYAKKAAQALAGLVDRKTVILKQYGTGGYNRVLAEVHTAAANVNLEMIHLGLAEVYKGKTPDGFDKKTYLKAEKRAKNSGRGMWSQGESYKSPRQWRREHPSP